MVEGSMVSHREVFQPRFLCLIIFIVPKVGVSSALASVIAGQLITALVFDAMGLFSLTQIPISAVRVIGVLLLLVGMRLMFVRS
jgi:transporter family-2 protein